MCLIYSTCFKCPSHNRICRLKIAEAIRSDHRLVRGWDGVMSSLFDVILIKHNAMVSEPHIQYSGTHEMCGTMLRCWQVSTVLGRSVHWNHSWVEISFERAMNFWCARFNRDEDIILVYILSFTPKFNLWQKLPMWVGAFSNFCLFVRCKHT